MPLILTARALNESPLSRPISASFGTSGGSIGRADTNTLALPDPKRHISRVQAEIAWQDGIAVLSNVGGPNPVAVDGRTLAPGASCPLKPGGQLQVGGYSLLIEWQDDAPSHRNPAPESAAGAGPLTLMGLDQEEKGGVSADPFSIFLPSRKSEDARQPLERHSTPAVGNEAPARPNSKGVPAATDDPFGDLGLDDFLPPPAGVEAGSAALSKASPPSVPQLVDDPFGVEQHSKRADALSDWGSSANKRERPGVPGLSVFGDLVAPQKDPASIDKIFGISQSEASGRDLLDDFLREDTPQSPKGKSAKSSVNDRVQPWDAPVDFVAPRAPSPKPNANPRPTPGRSKALDVAQKKSEALPQTPVRNDGPSPLPSVSAPTPELWQAFCKGAGIDASTAHPTAQHFEQLGSMMRASVDGIHALVMLRQHAKEELGSAVTQIRSKNNNPLKFSVDGSAALEQMMRPPMRGFMPAVDGISEACDDVLAHAIGTVAGMQAALKGVLDRFEPTVLESKLSSRSVFDSVLPSARKARLWELYVQHAAALREEATEDFESLYGKAFRRAYEAQIDRLHAERKS